MVHKTPMFRRLRFLQKPWITAALLAFLATDAWLISDHSSPHAGSYSVVGSSIHHAIHARVTMCRVSPYYYVHYRDGVVHVIDEGESSYDTIIQLIETESHNLYTTSWNRYDFASGFWAPWYRQEGASLSFHPLDGSQISPQAETVIRPAFAQVLSESAGSYWLQAATSDVRNTWIRWPGVAHNAGAATGLCLLVISLGWVPRAPAQWREHRRRRALRRGMCPACGYSTCGLPDGHCPECGEVWSGSDVEAVSSTP